MGSPVTLSTLGLYNWDSSIFDLMVIPSELDRQTLIDNLLAETAELEVLYPNPVVFKNLLGVWSAKELDVWNRLYETTQYEYDPIENYNRYEEGSESGTGHTTHSGTDTTTETRTATGKDTIDISRRDGGTETEASTYANEQGGSDTVDVTNGNSHWVAGFDAPTGTSESDGLVKQTRDQGNAYSDTDYGKTEEGSGSKTTTFGKTETDKHETTYGKTDSVSGSMVHGEQIATTNDGEHELHIHGNIGVTTTQAMIEAQRKIELFNVYDIIIEDFKMRFCILVY